MEAKYPTPFEELKAIMDRAYETPERDFAIKVLALLKKNGIQQRQDDGKLVAVTFSIATSGEPDTFVVGLRYRKRDQSFTEDTFIFTPGNTIVRCYGKKIESIHPEYEGTHKQQPRLSEEF
jgi:hypothetical protein